MDVKKVLVMGNSLPAEGLASLFSEIRDFELVGQVNTLPQADQLITDYGVDILVLIDDGRESSSYLGVLLSRHPSLPLIHANIDTDKIQVITSRCVGTGLDEFIQAISSLPLDRNGYVDAG